MDQFQNLQTDNTIGLHSPEIPDQVGPWFNSNPLKISILNSQNRIILIDFWTYSCVNCLRTLPFLKKWHEKYSSLGLTIIGVHTPEFEFEKDKNNVENFLKKEKIDYPVVMDNDYKIWHSFANKFWPRKYLIDPKGIIRLDHAGEGAYEETESRIQELLKTVSSQPLPNIESEHQHIKPGAVCYPMTAELYAGYYRGRFEQEIKQDQPKNYQAPETEEYQDGVNYLEGEWVVKNEFLQHARSTSEPADFAAIRYHGLEVNAVLKGGEVERYKIFVTRDGKPLEKQFSGKDIEFDKTGMSFVEVGEPKLYNLVKDKEYGDHILRLASLSPKMQLFAYTFGGCDDE